MKVKENGLEKRVLNLNPSAFFVPCNAHFLNLVVNDAAKCCLEATSFVSFVQHIYNYLSASTQHWKILRSHVSDLGITVKPLNETRLESCIHTLNFDTDISIIYHYNNI